MKIAVLGSGVIGVTTAWYLAQDGHEVIVIDRQPGPAQETSRATGNILTAANAEPWAHPSSSWRFLRTLLQDNTPFAITPSLDTQQWLWGASFFKERFRFEHYLRAITALTEYSLKIQQRLQKKLGLNYLAKQIGVLSFYNNEQDFNDTQEMLDVLRDFGIERRVLSPSEAIENAPVLASLGSKLVGADIAHEDRAGDAYLFSLQLTEECKKQGVRFLFNHEIQRLLTSERRIDAVEIITDTGKYENLQADCYVMALGAFSAPLLQAVGLAQALCPVKGYSATFDIVDPQFELPLSLVDVTHQLAYTQIDNQLRVAGLFDFTGYRRELSTKRCNLIVKQTKNLFPNLLDFDNVQFWSGLRAATPTGMPYIGRSPIQNLYLNTGHGTLGWTMSAGSARALADLIASRKPELEFPFLY